MKKYLVEVMIRVKYTLGGEGYAECYYPKYEIEAEDKNQARNLAYDKAYDDKDYYENETYKSPINFYLEDFDGTEDEFYEENYVYDVDFEVMEIEEVK